MFTPFSFTTPKPQPEPHQQQQQQSPLIAASLQVASNTKYLDLSPDLKSFLDNLEKTIHLSQQNADQQHTPLCLDNCTNLAKTLESASDLIQSQFELDQRCISSVQQASSHQFQTTEYTSHSLGKLKTGENLHPLQTKLIDEYFVVAVEALETKIQELNERMEKLLGMCKGLGKDEKSTVAFIEGIIKVHNDAILHLATRISQLRNK
jgi:hypothetical protein